MPYNSGRGGNRVGAGRPVGSGHGATVKRIYIPQDIDRQLLLDCYYALCDARDNSSTARTHDALNKVLDDVFGSER